MSKTKRTNPYTALRETARQYAANVNSTWRKQMWHYPKATISTDSWKLHDLAERVRAADQLGYDVRLRWDDNTGLIVEYVKRVPVPWSLT